MELTGPALTEKRIPDEFGLACAEALGVEAFCPVPPGSDGKVFLVEGDLVMKVTTSRVEAALCRTLVDADARGLLKVHDVRSTVLPDGGEAFVILRDDACEVFEDPGPEDALDRLLWSEAAVRFDGGWFLQDGRILDAALRDAPSRASLDRVATGLAWLRDTHGVVVRDLHLDNFGRDRDGHVCVRDLSRARVPEGFVEARLSDVEPLPSPGPRP